MINLYTSKNRMTAEATIHYPMNEFVCESCENSDSGYATLKIIHRPLGWHANVEPVEILSLRFSNEKTLIELILELQNLLEK